MTKVLIIGGGMAGCCAAHLLSEKAGWNIELVETAPFLGGGCKTHFYGGHPYTYGPRHFLTRDESLFEFLDRHVPMRRIEEDQFNFSYVESDAAFYYYPFHRDDIERMPDREQILGELKTLSGARQARNFEEYMAGSLGRTLYRKLVDTYSKKMWKIESNTELDSGDWGWRAWSPNGFPLKTGSKAAWSDAISGFPLKMNGYNDYFDVATRNVKVHLNTTIEEYDVEHHRVKIGGVWSIYDIIVSTISPEILLNNTFGPLRWIGRDFFKIVLPIKDVFPPNVYFLYYVNQEPFTRIVEYKKFYRYEAPSSLIVLEVPSFSNKLYPYPTQRDEQRAKEYLDSLPERVFSIGRAGVYRYVDIDDVIQQCLDLVKALA